MPAPSRRPTARRGCCATALLIAGLTVLGAGAAAAATGDLDPTWSGDGRAVQLAGAGQATASASLTGGALLVAGNGRVSDGSSANSGTYVSRYTPAGALDTTYGSGGTRAVSIGSGFESVRDVVVDASGRALVGGYVTAPDYPDETDLFVLRLTPSGAVDTAFGGGDGIVTIDRSNHDRGGALALSGNRILLAGGIDRDGNWGLEWSVFALTASGALDPGFSGDGVAQLPVAKVGSYDSLRDLAVQKDGRILLGGSTGTEFASARLTAAGAPDPTYSGDGVARVVVEGGGAGYRLLVQPDGKVVLAGVATPIGRSDTDAAAVRWTSAGALDPSFGGDGRVLVDSGPRRNDRAQSAALAADGKIVLVGSSDTATGMDSSFSRLNWNGTLDTSFSGDGQGSVSTLATSNEQLEAVTVTSGDALRAVGWNLEGWTLLGLSGGADAVLSVADASVTEPDTGTAAMTFTVRLSPASPTPVTVRYRTANGTAVAPGDLTAAAGTVTFPAGTTTRTITVPVVGDTAVEGDESFTVGLSLPTNAGLGDAVATGLVRDDD